jgi:AraC-like DNA-binding protein
VSVQEPKVFDQLHASVLGSFSELVSELGSDSASLLRRSAIEQEQSSVTYGQLVHLLELAAKELNCPDFGMRLAVRQKIVASYGPLGLVMRNSRTYGEALTYVSEHSYAHSLAARVRLVRFDDEEELFAAHDILLEGIAAKSQAIEQILLLGQLGALELTGGYARARKVYFRHQPLSTPKTYRKYFGCDVRFGQEQDGLCYTFDDLNCPIIDINPEAYQRATSTIDEVFKPGNPPMHAEVRGVLMRLLGGSTCTGGRVAAELTLHPRTMSRRLAEEGTSFQKIKDKLRRDLLLYYLKHTAMTFGQISEKLGFAEQAVLTRYCQEVFSRSPTMVRRGGT